MTTVGWVVRGSYCYDKFALSCSKPVLIARKVMFQRRANPSFSTMIRRTVVDVFKFVCVSSLPADVCCFTVQMANLVWTL